MDFAYRLKLAIIKEIFKGEKWIIHYQHTLQSMIRRATGYSFLMGMLLDFMREF